jgi:hypothetical protein
MSLDAGRALKWSLLGRSSRGVVHLDSKFDFAGWQPELVGGMK